MSQEKVLIVEDEENERTGLAELVSAWGYRAETANDGAEGYEKVTNLAALHCNYRPQNAAHGWIAIAGENLPAIARPWR